MDRPRPVRPGPGLATDLPVDVESGSVHRSAAIDDGPRRRKEITHRRDSSRKGPDVDHVADAAIADVQRSRILAALARLPVGEREAILATVYGGYTYCEAPEVLDQPEGTVESRIRRGMLRLRTILAGHAANDRDEVDLTRDPPFVPSSIVQGRIDDRAAP